MNKHTQQLTVNCGREHNSFFTSTKIGTNTQNTKIKFEILLNLQQTCKWWLLNVNNYLFEVLNYWLNSICMHVLIKYFEYLTLKSLK